MDDSYLNTLEGLLSLGSGAVAQPVSGLGGLLALLAGGTSEQAAKGVKNIQNALTYEPRSKEGKRFVSDVAGLLAPIGNAIEGAQTGAGDYIFDKTGSPLAGALTQALVGGAPDIAGGILGAKVLPKGQSYTIGDIGTQSSRFGGKQRGLFAGINAKGADLNALDKAKEMLGSGRSMTDVFTETGWFVGKDGKWRWEIDDSAASLTGAGQGVYGDVLKHNNLYGQYANDVMNIDTVTGEQKYKQGGYNPYEDNGPDYFPTQEEISAYTPNDILKRKTLLHEAQHAIQHREGFNTGGSPADFIEDIYARQEKAMEKVRDLNLTMNNAVKVMDEGKSLGNDFMYQMGRDAYDTAMAERARLIEIGQLDPMTEAMRMYRNLAGEREARAVEYRSDMSPEQRRATPPTSLFGSL